MEEHKKGKYDLEIEELRKTQTNLIEHWNHKLQSAHNTITALQPSINKLESKDSPSPEISQLINLFNSAKTKLSTIQSDFTPESFDSSLAQLEKLNDLIQISETELSKTLKIVVNQDEKYKKQMEIQHFRQKLLNNEIDKVKDEIKENEEIVQGIQGEIERMRKMKVLKEREVLEIKNRIMDKEEELRSESGSLDVIRKNFEEYERSTDEEILGNVDGVCTVQKKGEGEIGERWEISVFVIPSFLVLVLALIILI